jgi:hypothetical protein
VFVTISHSLQTLSFFAMGGKGKGKAQGNSSAPSPPQPPKLVYKVWLPYCPFPDLCTKGAAHLGRCYSKGEAESKVFNHLNKSPFHDLDNDCAGQAIEQHPECVVEMEEEWTEKELEEYDRQHQQQQSNQGHSDSRKRKALEGGSQSSASAAHVVASAVAEMQHHSQEQLKAAYSFCKACFSFFF